MSLRHQNAPPSPRLPASKGRQNRLAPFSRAGNLALSRQDRRGEKPPPKHDGAPFPRLGRRRGPKKFRKGEEKAVERVEGRRASQKLRAGERQRTRNSGIGEGGAEVISLGFSEGGGRKMKNSISLRSGDFWSHSEDDEEDEEERTSPVKSRVFPLRAPIKTQTAVDEGGDEVHATARSGVATWPTRNEYVQEIEQYGRRTGWAGLTGKKPSERPRKVRQVRTHTQNLTSDGRFKPDEDRNELWSSPARGCTWREADGAVSDLEKRDIVKRTHSLRNSPVWPDTLEKLERGQNPSSAKEFQQVLGILGYRRKCIPGFPIVARPLYSLLKKGRSGEWTERHTNAPELLTKELSFFQQLGPIHPTDPVHRERCNQNPTVWGPSRLLDVIRKGTAPPAGAAQKPTVGKRRAYLEGVNEIVPISEGGVRVSKLRKDRDGALLFRSPPNGPSPIQEAPPALKRDRTDRGELGIAENLNPAAPGLPPRGLFFNELLLQRTAPSTDCSFNALLLQRTSSSTDFFFNGLLLQRTSPSTDFFFNGLLLQRTSSSTDSFNGLLLQRIAPSTDCSFNGLLLQRTSSSMDCSFNGLLLQRTPSTDCSFNGLLLQRIAPSTDFFFNGLLLQRTFSSTDCSFNGLLLQRTSSSTDSFNGLLLQWTAPSTHCSFNGLLQRTSSSTDFFFNGLLLQQTSPSTDCSFNGLLLQRTAPSMDCSFNALLLQWTSSSTDFFFNGLFLQRAAPSTDFSFNGLLQRTSPSTDCFFNGLLLQRTASSTNCSFNGLLLQHIAPSMDFSFNGLLLLQRTSPSMDCSFHGLLLQRLSLQ
ncbi:uncharacterized protein LOC141737231 [Larus michahellis]|uniref:uncharacterized protein LOC141737231 n=1 Tax=Larus michahellis TaxID=119627 RepID=UPI003D9B0CC9